MIDSDRSRAIWCAEFNRGGNLVAVGTSSGLIWLHKISRSVYPSDSIFYLSPVVLEDGHSQGVLRIVWAGDNHFLSCGLDRRIIVWSSQTMDKRALFEFDDIIVAVDVHPLHPFTFLACDINGGVHFIQYDSQQKSSQITSKHVDGTIAITFGRFVSGGEMIAVGLDDGSVVLIDSRRMQPLGRLLPPCDSAHLSAPKVVGIENDPQGAPEILVSYNGYYPCSFSLRTYCLIAVYVAESYLNDTLNISAFYSHSGDRIISGSEGPQAFVWMRMREVPDLTVAPFLHWVLSHSFQGLDNIPVARFLSPQTVQRALSRLTYYNQLELACVITGDSNGDLTVWCLASRNDPPLPLVAPSAVAQQATSPNDLCLQLQHALNSFVMLEHRMSNYSGVTHLQSSLALMHVKVRKVSDSQNVRANVRRLQNYGHVIAQICRLLQEYTEILGSIDNGFFATRWLQKSRCRKRLENLGAEMYAQVEYLGREILPHVVRGEQRPVIETVVSTAGRRGEVISIADIPTGNAVGGQDAAAASRAVPTADNRVELTSMSSDAPNAPPMRDSGSVSAAVNINMEERWRQLLGGEPRVAKAESIAPDDLDAESVVLNMADRIIENAEGAALWKELFGELTYQVAFDEFVVALAEHLNTELLQSDQECLHRLLDCEESVTMFQFHSFYEYFCPLSRLLRNVRYFGAAPWFYGHMSHLDANSLLFSQPVGTYLVRLSRSERSSLAMAYVKEPQVIVHLLIRQQIADGSATFQVEDHQSNSSSAGSPVQGRAVVSAFDSFQGILQAYQHVLVRPFQSGLPRASCFVGDMTSVDAEAVLLAVVPGSYLVRFSTSSPGDFVVSYRDAGGSVQHCLVHPEPLGGYTLAGDPVVYPTAEDLFRAYPNNFEHPISARAIRGDPHPLS